MTAFTKDELEVLTVALDMMVRAEGNAMNQGGIAGIRSGNTTVLLTRRLKLSVSALAKVDEQRAAVVEAESAASEADAAASEPVGG